MLAADARVAADDARFGQIKVKRGIYPVGGATIRFVQNIGWGNSMRYLLTGDEFGASEAHRMGLVQEVTAAAREDGYFVRRGRMRPAGESWIRTQRYSFPYWLARSQRLPYHRKSTSRLTP